MSYQKENKTIQPPWQINNLFAQTTTKLTPQVRTTIGTETVKTIQLKQIHSNKAVLIENYSDKIIVADALVTSLPNIRLSVKTADCAPILLVSTGKTKTIAAIHAGYRGAINNIIKNTLDLFPKDEKIIAWIGPCISKNHYEVKATSLIKSSNPVALNNRIQTISMVV